LRIAKRNGWTVTLLTVMDRAGGRHPVPAMVFADGPIALHSAQDIWPDYEVRPMAQPPQVRES
jgi:hypothetical protein